MNVLTSHVYLTSVWRRSVAGRSVPISCSRDAGYDDRRFPEFPEIGNFRWPANPLTSWKYDDVCAARSIPSARRVPAEIESRTRSSSIDDCGGGLDVVTVCMFSCFLAGAWALWRAAIDISEMCNHHVKRMGVTGDHFRPAGLSLSCSRLIIEAKACQRVELGVSRLSPLLTLGNAMPCLRDACAADGPTSSLWSGTVARLRGIQRASAFPDPHSWRGLMPKDVLS